MTTSYSFTGQCIGEWKRLRKKYRSLPDDLEEFCKFTLQLEKDVRFPSANKNYTLLKEEKSCRIFKARMACASLRGNKFRVVYARHDHSIEIIFIELYSKNERKREDAARIKAYLSNIPV